MAPGTYSGIGPRSPSVSDWRARESIPVPGYRYRPPVSGMLSRARQSDVEGDRGPMPL